MAKRVNAPPLLFEKNQRRTIDQAGEAMRLRTSPGEGGVSQADGGDLADRICKKHFVAHNGGERQSAYKKKQDDLKRRHLFARMPPNDANNKHQKEIAEKRPHYGSH